MQVRDLLSQAARLLPGEEARREAALLLQHVLRVPAAWLIAHADDAVDHAQVAAFQDLIERRVCGEPIAYLTGVRGFHELELKISPDVLIPRPETEVLVELALARIPTGGSPDAAAQRRNPGPSRESFPDSAALHPGYAVADLGTGSGAIALAIAKARPHARVLATDVSEAALAVARGNATHLGIGNVEFKQGTWCGPLADERFDVIASNPPYVAAGDPYLHEGDLRFEPPLALSPGPDGLSAIRVIARQAVVHLANGGWLLIEHGFEQGASVRALLQHSGYRDVFTQCDLENRERVTGGRVA